MSTTPWTPAGTDDAQPPPALTTADLERLEDLADAAERGELTPIRDAGPRGEAAVDEFNTVLLAATGGSTPEEAARLALGRHRGSGATDGGRIASG